MEKPLTSLLSLPHSGSSCSLAAGLESLGLTDIRTLVRLMCLAAAGRAGLSTSPTSGSGGHSERPRGAAKASKPISCLAYLSTAVGCLASNSPNAAKLLVQLCTQVRDPAQHPPGRRQSKYLGRPGGSVTVGWELSRWFCFAPSMQSYLPEILGCCFHFFNSLTPVYYCCCPPDGKFLLSQPL